jgi:hypothetical protein
LCYPVDASWRIWMLSSALCSLLHFCIAIFLLDWFFFQLHSNSQPLVLIILNNVSNNLKTRCHGSGAIILASYLKDPRFKSQLRDW